MDSLVMPKQSQKRDYSISCVRLVAMILIVSCHMMQNDDFASDIHGAHIGWAFWFNVGVQMFLFISGYLYGKKNRIDIVEFYKKSFSKLLIDYYVFVFIILIAIHFSPLWDTDSNGIIGLLTFSSTIPGLGHLWFVPTILFCYLLSPILSEVLNAIDKRSNIRFWVEAILVLLIIHVVIKRFFGNFNPAWVNCFVMGMIYSRIEQKGRRSKRAFACLTVVLCLIIIPLQFRIDYWPHEELPSFFANRYIYFQNYGHVFLGIAMVMLIRIIYNRIHFSHEKHYILDWSDKYSYDVYLVHHVFVQSAFACVGFIDNRMLALPLALILTVLSSMIIYYISKQVRNKSIAAIAKLPN